MPRRHGFSLVELLIVMAIIGIIATIAIPILLNARRNALNEKARQCIRTVLSAEAAWYARQGEYGTLAQLSAPPDELLDNRYTSGVGEMGHGLTISLELDADGQSFLVTTDNQGGSRNFAGDHTLLIWEQ